MNKEWITASLSDQIERSNTSGDTYGYQFWLWNNQIDNKTIPAIAALGNGNQRIFFDKKNHLIVVITAGNYNTTIANNSNKLLTDLYGSFAF